MLQCATGKNICQCSDTTGRRVGRLGTKPIVQYMSIYTGDGDRGSRPDDDEHHQRENDSLAQLGNFENVEESGDHLNGRLSAYHNRAPSLFNLLTRRLTEFVGFDGQFFGDLTTTKYLYSIDLAV